MAKGLIRTPIEKAIPTKDLPPILQAFKTAVEANKAGDLEALYSPGAALEGLTWQRATNAGGLEDDDRRSPWERFFDPFEGGRDLTLKFMSVTPTPIEGGNAYEGKCKFQFRNASGALSSRTDRYEIHEKDGKITYHFSSPSQ